ncbi:NAD(P)/FAD-dependent oxidoreductase [Gemmatimonadota bacterium]
MRSEQIVIIGAGPAGCAAAVQCARLGVKPYLIDRSGKPGGLLSNAWQVENYPGIEPTDGRNLVSRLKEFLDRFDIMVDRKVIESVSYDGDRYLLESSGGGIHARAVIVATGTRPILLDVPGAEELREKKLWYEITGLLELVSDPGHIAVIGGGEAALDYSLSLAGAGGPVTLLVRGEAYRACRRLSEAVEESQTITPLFGIEVVRVESTRRGLSVVCSDSGEHIRLECDGAVAALGRESTASDLLKDHPVMNHDSVHTGCRGLFIVGDARLGTLGQAGIAVGDGLEAAMTAVSVVEEGGK